MTGFYVVDRQDNRPVHLPSPARSDKTAYYSGLSPMPQLVCAIQTLKRTQALIEQAVNDAEPYERWVA